MSVNNTLSKCTNSINENHSYVRANLPVITIPLFSGKSSEYKTFIGLFNSLIDSDTRLDNIQKLYYLRNFLQDEPLCLIKNLPLIGESYSESLIILKDRYDNKYKIINDHICTLLDLPPITNSTAENIRSFVCAIKQQLAALRNLSQPVEKWDQILLCILIRKLDWFCNREYQLQLNLKEEPSIINFLVFLEKRAWAMEASMTQPIPALEENFVRIPPVGIYRVASYELCDALQELSELRFAKL
ncbi:hypothetical protein K1T71_013036 [Dendrolimus kikuchii]|uniref:Uncharacterized protein n=1 Tax=Dendrolimus kikuchii TaxID=765133 RepID=A0ACC1CJ14_9NEOP|nr:hypothetical protein K1T71_013036 [Dendrolimus kikuchii]